VSTDSRLAPNTIICVLETLLIFSRLMALISYFGLKFNSVSVKCNMNGQFDLDVVGQRVS